MSTDNNNTQPTSFKDIDIPKEHWNNESVQKWCKVIGIPEKDILTIRSNELDGFWLIFKYISGNLEKDLKDLGVSLPSSVRIFAKFNPLHTQDFSKKRRYEQTAEIQKKIKESIKITDAIRLFPKDPFTSNTPNSRYNFENNVLNIIEREITNRLAEFIDATKKTKRTVYIHGPQGFGKSYSIYQIISILRNDNNIVFYMPDCGTWSSARNPYFYFSEIMYYSFYLVNDDTFVNDYWRSKPFNESNFENFLDELGQHCNRKQYSLYFFFDQHNGIPENKREVYPFSLIENYLAHEDLWRTSLICVSASSNNFYQFGSSKTWPTFRFNSTFTDQEFQIFSNHFNFKFTESFDETLELIKELTNLIPLEIQEIYDIWCNQQKSTDLKYIINLYKEKREFEICMNNQVFTRDYLTDDSSKKDFARNVILMELGIPSFKMTLINERLMIRRGQIIEATTPLARNILVECWKDELDYKTTKEGIYKLVFNREIAGLTNDVRRGAIEIYIIEEIIRLKEFSFIGFNIIKNNGKLEKSYITFAVHNLQPFYFNGKNVKNCDSSWHQNQIIIPNASNFPEVDFLIWNSNDKHLYAIQVTIKDLSNNWDKYQLLWKKQTGYEETKVLKVWITFEPFFNLKESLVGHYLMYMHNLGHIGNSFLFCQNSQ
ncbi:hypothetical protein DLAC_10497 [Tieghemostelium lacteum]|uniref:Uncharacterized protein n=1 Tax=Tieghemostelium lacteum TaxID=361077 RepID=A0A151Z4N5_TIELA|nr:hypothetical protein DLAC_10497 [Tieghemostelium lacteum]|eukprot:KYQ88916.1 hypothetical protein DLAC_10497 [Tieghemostelium lacteum]